MTNDGPDAVDENHVEPTLIGDAKESSLPVATDDASTQQNAVRNADESTHVGVAETVFRSPSGNAESSVPSDFGDYELIREIARGGMGVVYQARQLKANRLVAIKMILAGQFASKADVSRFYAEAESAARLDHPNIVPIFDVGRHGNHHFFSMAFVDGESLADRIRTGPMPPHEAAAIVRTIADAVSYAHQQGVIHRDLKPGNVLVSKSGDLRVTDFGLAKQIDSGHDLTATHQVLGTPNYMPPEQAAGQAANVGVTADVYSIGAIMYALVTGRPPFQAASQLDTLRQVMERDPVAPHLLLPELDADYETICLKCLEKQPSSRYANAGALRDELDRYLNGQPITARPVGSVERAWRWCKRNRLVASLASGVIASLVVGLVVSTYFAWLATTRAERAREGTRIALDSLETVINTVQKKLRTIPAAREVRREILRDSLADLDTVAGELTLQSRVDRDTALVLMDLAELFGEVGDESGAGMSQSAEKYFLQAVEILRTESRRDPDDVPLGLDYSRALNRLGNFYLDHDQPMLAKPALEEVLGRRRSGAAVRPNEPAALLDLTYGLANWGDFLASQRNFGDALSVYEEAITVARRLVDLTSDSVDYQLRLADCMLRAGDACHDMGRHDEALAYFTPCLEIAKAAYEADESSIAAIDAVSFAEERLGNHWLANQGPQKALFHYAEMLRLAEQSLEADPKNRYLIDGLSIAHEKMAQAFSANGDAKSASESRRLANEFRTQLQ